MKKRVLQLSWILMLGAVITLSSCGDDELGPAPDARFNVAQDAMNPLKWTFENVSLNATSHSWDFGDGNSSTEESPVHEYASGGNYTVVLTATGDGGQTDTREETIQAILPVERITGTDPASSKVWKLVREGRAVWQESKLSADTEWGVEWSFGDGGAATFDERPCMLTDEYSFKFDGTYGYETNLDYWSNPTLKLSWGCQEVSNADAYLGTADEDFSAWGSNAAYTFEYDEPGATLKVSGLGAFIVFFNRTEAGVVTTPQTSTTYTIDKLEDMANGVDTLKLTVAYDAGDDRTRRFRYTLVSYDNPEDEPSIPGPPPTASFTVTTDGTTATFTNTSELGDSFAWDFGDGNTSTDMSPVYDYGADGFYNVTLVATNVDGEDDSSKGLILGSMNLTFEGDEEVSFFTFTGASSINVEKIANPVSGGMNTSDNVMQMDKGDGASTWSGFGASFATKFDFSTANSITMKVYSPAIGQVVRLKLEESGNTGNNTDVRIASTVADEWEEMTFTFDAVDHSGQFNNIVIYFDYDLVGTGSTHYFDDIVQQ